MKRSIEMLEPRQITTLISPNTRIDCPPGADDIQRMIKAYEFFDMPIPKKLKSWLARSITEDRYGHKAEHDDYTKPFPKGHREWFERWRSKPSNLTEEEDNIIAENLNFEDVLKDGTPTQCQQILKEPVDISEEQLARVFRKTNHLTRVDFELHRKHYKNFTWKVLMSLTDRQFVDTLDKLQKAEMAPSGPFPEAAVKGRLFTIVLRDPKRKDKAEDYGQLLEVLKSQSRFFWYRVMKHDYRRDEDHLGNAQNVVYFGLIAAGHQIPENVAKAFESSVDNIDADVITILKFLDNHEPHPRTLELIGRENLPILDRQVSIEKPKSERNGIPSETEKLAKCPTLPETTSSGPAAASPAPTAPETTASPDPACAAPLEEVVTT